MVQELFAYFFGIYIKFATTLDTQVNKDIARNVDDFRMKSRNASTN